MTQRATRFGNGYLFDETPPPHRCDFPGRFMQWFGRIKPGRQWICATCKMQFTLMPPGKWTLTNTYESHNEMQARIEQIIASVPRIINQ